jgi:alpha-glucosidase (family GH31 glycosyl hydrolase)
VNRRCLIGLSLAVACSDGKEATTAGDTADPGATDEAPWPEWAFHHWVWEDESTQESALALVDGYLAHDIPVGAIIIDSPWATGYSTFEWDPALFPDPQEMIDTLHAQGVRVFVWTVPGINTDVLELYAEAADNGWFMQGDADSGPKVVSWWKGEGSLIDYFNPDAVTWWHGLVDKTLAYGIDGWKCDGLDFSALLADYSPGAGREVERIEYSAAYYRDFFDYTRASLGDDRLITARPVDNYGADLGGEVVSFAPVDINWAGWVGDQDATFAGLRAALSNMYWSADMNYVAFGSDIGGYREESGLEHGRDKEVFIRWAQLGALSPIMENGGSGEHRPWAFDDETTEIYRRFTELHYALLPYLMTQGGVAFADGTSLHDFLDKDAYTYRLGTDLLVAPVLDAGGAYTVVFPADEDWIYLFDTGVVHSGGATVSDTVVLDEYPVFVRAGSGLADELADGALVGD